MDFSCCHNYPELPYPLNDEEEKSLINELANGSKSARNKLIESNMRLVHFIARKFENTGCELDELISVGYVGLIKGVDSFDCCRGIKLSTYVSKCITNEILMRLRHYRSKEKTVLSLNDVICLDKEGNELTFADILSDIQSSLPNNDYWFVPTCSSVEDAIISEYESKAILIQLRLTLKKLTGTERKVIIIRFLSNSNIRQVDAARILGISQSYMSRLEKRAIQKLKMRFSAFNKE